MNAIARSLLTLFLTIQFSMQAAAAKAAEGVTGAAAPQGQVVSVTDDRLILNFPKWQPNGYDENIGLEVRFRWKPDAEWRSGVTKDAGTDWVVIFPDRPEAGEKVTLQLVYRFKLDDTAKKKVSAAVNDVVTLAVAAVVAALDKADAAARAAAPADQNRTRRDTFAQSAPAILSDLGPRLESLAEFTSNNGKAAGDVVLEQLGFRRGAGADAAWTLSLQNLGPLSALEGLSLSLSSVEQSLVNLKTQVIPPDAANAKTEYGEACRASLENAWKSARVAATVEVVEACSASLEGKVPAAAPSLSAFRVLSKAFAERAFSTVHEVNAAASQLTNALGAVVIASADAQKQHSFHALLFATQSMIAARLTELRDGIATRLTETIVERRLTLQQDRAAQSLLELEARRRMYDAATGFVYVGMLGDVIMPTLLAICPWGCLKSDKGTGDWGFTWHTVSVDLGVKAATLGDSTDPRHDGALGFLIGASWNPIDVVRISAGGYVFENQQQADKDFNLTYYGGFSVNVLHAGELLGIFGMSSPPKAKLTPKSQ